VKKGQCVVKLRIRMQCFPSTGHSADAIVYISNPCQTFMADRWIILPVYTDGNYRLSGSTPTDEDHYASFGEP